MLIYLLLKCGSQHGIVCHLPQLVGSNGSIEENYTKKAVRPWAWQLFNCIFTCRIFYVLGTRIDGIILLSILFSGT